MSVHRALRLATPAPEKHISVWQHVRMNCHIRQFEELTPPPLPCPGELSGTVYARSIEIDTSRRSVSFIAGEQCQPRSHEQREHGPSTCCKCHVPLSTEPACCAACCVLCYNAGRLWRLRCAALLVNAQRGYQRFCRLLPMELRDTGSHQSRLARGHGGHCEKSRMLLLELARTVNRNSLTGGI